MASKSKAYKAGYEDGAEWCRDQDIQNAHESEPVLSYEDGLNADGKVRADEGLINACGGSLLGDVLGLTRAQTAQRGSAFRKACADYNDGWDAAIRAAIKHRDNT